MERLQTNITLLGYENPRAQSQQMLYFYTDMLAVKYFPEMCHTPIMIKPL